MKNPAILNYNDNEKRLADWEIDREASRGSSGGGGYSRSRGSGDGGSITLFSFEGLVQLEVVARKDLV